MAQTTRIQLRKGTAQEWQETNPVLFIGEIGIDTSNYRAKSGDGFSTWNELPYIDDHGLQLLRDQYGDEFDFIYQLELSTGQ